MNRVIEVKPGETVEVRTVEDPETKKLRELYESMGRSAAEHLKNSVFSIAGCMLGGLAPLGLCWPTCRRDAPPSRFKPGDRVRIKTDNNSAGTVVTSSGLFDLVGVIRDSDAQLHHYNDGNLELIPAKQPHDEADPALSVTSPAHRFKVGDRVKVKMGAESVPEYWNRSGTVRVFFDEFYVKTDQVGVELDYSPDLAISLFYFHACDLELIPVKAAPALPGEWREVPDANG
jgi:hypothetical protein